jgi:preprotein translocase subunit SecA
LTLEAGSVRVVREFKQALGALTDSELAQGWRDLAREGSDLVSVAVAATAESCLRTFGAGLSEDEIDLALELCRGGLVPTMSGLSDHLAAAPACLAVLSDSAFHVMVVDDDCAKRNAGNLSRILGRLGVEVAHLPDAYAGHRAVEARRSAYGADVVVASWEQFAYDYLRDNLEVELESRVGHRQGWVFLTEADQLLLDRADFPLIIGADERTLARIPFAEYVRRYQQVCGLTSAYTSEIELTAIRATYGASTSTAGDEPRASARDDRDIEYFSSAARLDAMARIAARTRDQDAALVLVVDPSDIWATAEHLVDKGVEHEVIVNDSSASHRAWAEAASVGQITVATRDFIGCHQFLGDPTVLKVNVVVCGRAHVRRLDHRVRALARIGQSDGRCAFLVTATDEVMRPFAAPPGGPMSRFVFRGRRRTKGVRLSRFQMGLVAKRQESLERDKARRWERWIKLSAVERDQREEIYAERDRILELADPLPEVDALVHAVVGGRGRPERNEISTEDVMAQWQGRVEELGSAVAAEFARHVILSCLDRGWREHLTELDLLWDGLGKGGSDSVDGFLGYSVAANRAFTSMRRGVEADALDYLLNLELA